MKSRNPYKGSKMKARIQSIEQLKEIATRELQTEIDQQISDALLDGAAQGMAYVMWVLEISYGWKDARQKKLFEEMKGFIKLGENWRTPITGGSIVNHIKERFGLDVDELLHEECSTDVAEKNPDVKAAGN